MLSVSQFSILLQSKLSPCGKVFSDPEESQFKHLLLRWSDTNVKIPGAIILAGTEQDVLLSVKFAVENGIPFVCKSGGHSIWSTIGKEGVILDLSQLKKIEVNKQNAHITVQTGVLIKEANDAAWEEGWCLPLGSANTAGVIPMAIGGGLSVISSICGFASDNIVSSRVITADGRLVVADASSHPDLFYAIRGAGQHFGVVTELTLQAYPISILGTPEGSVWTGSMIFPVEKAELVFGALASLIPQTSVPAVYACIICAPPPQNQTVILIIPIFFGIAVEAEKFFEPLLSLEPGILNCRSTPYVRFNDLAEGFNKKGGFKRWAGTGIHTFEPEMWMKVVACFEELKAKCPDAATHGGGYSIMCNVHVPEKKPQVTDTAFSHHDIKMWGEALSWYTDPSSHENVVHSEKNVLDMVQKGQDASDEAAYQNWSREPRVELRYRGSERLNRLKYLKKKWDPKGIFTEEFLYRT